jgi:PIN domain nuclease of toxin-antitoxin system
MKVYKVKLPGDQPRNTTPGPAPVGTPRRWASAVTLVEVIAAMAILATTALQAHCVNTRADRHALAAKAQITATCVIAIERYEKYQKQII